MSRVKSLNYMKICSVCSTCLRERKKKIEKKTN